MDFIIQNFNEFLIFTGFANASAGNLIMILVGALFIWLAIKKDFEPLLLVPIGLGIILGNIPFRADAGLEIGLYEDNSVLNIFYQGVKQGWYPPLVFLGIGAMTDFSALISNPKLILIGAAAQFGIFGAYMIALALGFEPNQASWHCHYRRSRRTNRHLPEQQTESEPHGSHCGLRLLLHGTGACNPATFDATTYNQERARHQDETGTSGFTDRKDSLPYHRSASHHLYRSIRFAIIRNAVLRKSSEREWKDNSTRQDSKQ